MLARDPFKPPARHARPRRTPRRAMIGASAAIAAAGVLVLAGHAHAATRPASDLGGIVAHAATGAASGFTPSPGPMIPARVSQTAHGPLGASGLHWERVSPAAAHELGISPRSVMIIGARQTVIVTPRGTVAGSS